jgi:CshA-type fibril repeat protein
VHLTVTPTAVDDSATTPPNTPVSINVILNDHGSALTVTSVTQPAHGSVVIVGGEPVFTPPTGFSGTTTFTYTATDAAGQTATATVTVTVPPVVGAAVARDDTRHGKSGHPVTLRPLHNDTPSHGATWQTSSLRLINPKTKAGVTTLVVAGEGNWTVTSGGVVTFTPEAGFTGDPTPVRYSVLDSNNHLVKATIRITYLSTAGGGTSTGPTSPTGPGHHGGDPTGDPTGTDPTGVLPHTGVAALLGTLWLGSGGIMLGTLLVAWGSRGGRRRRRNLRLLG